MAELLIRVHTHHFEITKMSIRTREAMMRYLRKLTQWELVKENGRWTKAPKCMFAARTKDFTEYRLHINLLEDFKLHLKVHQIPMESIDIEMVEIKRPEHVDIPIKEGWAPRERQLAPIEYITKDIEPGDTRSKMLDLQTGGGKSFTSMWCAAKLGLVTCYLFRPSYLSKWAQDIRKTYDIGDDEYITVQGSDELKTVMQRRLNGELNDMKVYLISNKTFQNYLKLYEQFGNGILEMGFACLPQHFFEFMGIGFRVIDEVHLDFHLNFKIDLYTHCWLSLSLSATLISDNDFIVEMHKIAYPPMQRYVDGTYKKYVAVYVTLYNLRNPHKIRCVDWRSGRYSHNAFEQSLLKNTVELDNYVRLIAKELEEKYFLDKKDGDRALVFCASIDFCTFLTNRLRDEFPTLQVERYVGSLNDPYENLIGKDICVSTHGTSGTAQDVPQLTYVLMTQSMKSSPGSMQNLGRLRELADGRTPIYSFLVCADIPKHLEYHQHRLKLLDNRADTLRIDHSRVVV